MSGISYPKPTSAPANKRLSFIPETGAFRQNAEMLDMEDRIGPVIGRA